MAAAPAAAGPPLVADDPHTIGRGSVELIVAASTRVDGDEAFLEAPLLDATLGLAEGLDATLVASLAQTLDDSRHDVEGALVSPGVKWRFFSGRRVTASFTPALGIDTSDPGALAFSLPVQAELALGPFALGTDVDYSLVRRAPDAWRMAVYATWTPHAGTILLAEVFALSAGARDDADVGFSLGADWALAPGLRLLVAAGTGIASEGKGRLDARGYLGLRWDFRLPLPERRATDAAVRPSSSR